MPYADMAKLCSWAGPVIVAVDTNYVVVMLYTMYVCVYIQYDINITPWSYNYTNT